MAAMLIRIFCFPKSPTSGLKYSEVNRIIIVILMKEMQVERPAGSEMEHRKDLGVSDFPLDATHAG